ncbi:FtsX-like permease family protein [Rhodocytophaga rosea]|uniref:FtsX-like permease family protein n=1 Tax=Rhodocytophaga rosea TaxID=2704465 RepID=A0A6C0GMQ5_9BACT|nr:ABC transporter permease [Rhodocytophaga rosea]QHT69217.1 FtsX-like permease family protein [Rhodocytophaga rosea]
MLKNYITIALRNISKHRVYTLLNVSGLAVSLAVATLIMLYVKQEHSYDRWIPNAENVYRVYRYWAPYGSAWTPPPLGHTIKQEFGEIQAATRLSNDGKVLLTTQANKSLYTPLAVSTDSNFLAVFKLPLLHGDAGTALLQPYSVVLNSELAIRLYGNTNPVGQTLRVNNKKDYKITGILAPYAGKTHLEAELYYTDPDSYYYAWDGNDPTTYVSLHPQTNIAKLENKVTALINEFVKEERKKYNTNIGELPQWRFQPVSDVHLYSTQMNGPFVVKGNYQNSIILGTVAIVILLIASINYMNLATAQAGKRAREVGIRKVSGANRRELVFQFLSEASLQSLTAIPLVILLATVFLPAFNVVTDRNLVLGWNEWLQVGGYLIALVLLLGILSGLYPAFFLSAYRPVEVLKGKFSHQNRGQFLRRSLVIMQFAMAITVAIVMTFIYRQVQYMQDQELGFSSDQTLVVRINTPESVDKIQALKGEMQQNPHISAVTTASSLPGTFAPDNMFKLAGEQEDHLAHMFWVDPDYVKTLGLQLAQGQFFSWSDYTDTTGRSFVVNEAFVKEYNLKNPVGHQIGLSGQEKMGTIIGVVKDFHFQSLASEIQPMILLGNVKSRGASYAAIRMNTKEIRSTVAYIEKIWKQVEPIHPIQYTFLNDDFAQLYDDQVRLGQTLLYTTLLTIFIAALGLFGLASFMAEQRVKEIGVRKVLGASVSQLVVLLGKDFLKLVFIAGVVAVPFAIWITREWLSNFAYSIPISVMPFVLAIGASLLIAALTVSGRAIKAALLNPVKSLRNE